MHDPLQEPTNYSVSHLSSKKVPGFKYPVKRVGKGIFFQIRKDLIIDLEGGKVGYTKYQLEKPCR